MTKKKRLTKRELELARLREEFRLAEKASMSPEETVRREVRYAIEPELEVEETKAQESAIDLWANLYYIFTKAKKSKPRKRSVKATNKRRGK